MSHKLSCIGILRAKPSSRFEFVVRWFINDTDNNKVTWLPNPEGKFEVTIRTVNSREYIKPDGSVAPIPAGPLTLPVITPMNYLMVAPPPGTSKPPVAPVDPGKQDGSTGVGIYNILADTQPSRYKQKIVARTLKAISSRPSVIPASFFDKQSAKGYSNAFADYLYKDQINPGDLQALYVHAFKQLGNLQLPGKDVKKLVAVPRIFSFHLDMNGLATADFDETLRSVMQQARFMGELLRDVDFLRDIDQEIQTAESLKSQFSFLGIQGAEIIDYWWSPYVSKANRDENYCGKKYFANETVGLGCTVGDIDAATVKRWYDSNDSIMVSVKYIPPTKAELLAVKVYDWKNLHDNDMLEIVPGLTSLATPITNKGANSLENAIVLSSSCPPGTPIKAVVDFDLYLKRMKTNFNAEPGVPEKIPFAENLDIATGDGRLQLQVVKPPTIPLPQGLLADGSFETEMSSIINGVNIYGLWEPEEATSIYKKYFNDPAVNPSSPKDIQEIQPWLITRRYSCNADLIPFFAANNPNLDALKVVPPRTPAFQSASNIISRDRILRILSDNTVQHEAMPRTKLAASEEPPVLFSLDIREGFKNSYDEKLHQTWDKRPLTNTDVDWDPTKWRGVKNPATPQKNPQAYRFWATSVDIFGQESSPIPVEIKETSGSAPGTLFYFKNRIALQPPPSNDTQHTDRLQLVYTAEKLKVSWESPFKNTVGNHIKETDVPGRMEKNRLACNLVILRKPHSTFSRVLADDQLDKYIETMIFPSLDATQRNDKWKIGFREMMKHNGNWLVYKTEKGLTDTTVGDKWKYETALTKADWGFDYMVLVNFTIPNGQEQFWTASDMTRSMQLLQQERANATNQSFYAQRLLVIQETPVISNVAFTSSVLVANPMLPRQAELPAFSVTSAMPVPGIQGLNRDQLLSNILTTPDAIAEVDIDGVKTDVVTFVSGKAEQEKGILYTGAQLAMVSATLQRCEVPAGYDVAVSKGILFRELSNLNRKIFPEKNGWHLFTKESNQNIIANSMIGFRGLVTAKFRYESIYTSGETDRYSEATRYFVHQARIQLSENIGANASLASTSFNIGGNNNFTDVIFDRTASLVLDQPTFVICRYTKGYTISQLKQFSHVQNKYNLQLAAPLLSEGTITGNPDKLFVVLADQIHESDFEVNDKGYYEENVLLPIGGGFREFIIWSFTTSSALGKQAASPLLRSKVFQSSILPPMPAGMSGGTISTAKEKDQYVLDKTNVAHKNWIPKHLQAATGDLKRFPRNYIRYTKDNNLPDDVYLCIERDFRSENGVVRALAGIRNIWELASKLEKLQIKETNELNDDGTPNMNYNPKGILFLKWLSEAEPVSLYKWLFSSAIIEVPGEMQARVSVTSVAERQLAGPLSALFISNQQHLSANSALIRDPFSTTPPSVMFIDYFYDNGDPDLEMDTFRSYNYRIQTYIDIDPKGDLGIKDPAQKYLYSRPTEWTDWIRPAFPEIEDLSIVSDNPEPADILTPQVHLSFVLSQPKLKLAGREASNNLFYRIIVRREVKNAISSYSGGPEGSMFTEVGDLLDLPVASTAQGGAVYDLFLERENIGTKLSNRYQIEVVVISKDTKDRIQIIRKPFLREFAIILETPPQGKEILKIVQFVIK